MTGFTSPRRLSLQHTRRLLVPLVLPVSVDQAAKVVHTALLVVTVMSTGRRKVHLANSGHNLLVLVGELPESKWVLDTFDGGLD